MRANVADCIFGTIINKSYNRLFHLNRESFNLQVFGTWFSAGTVFIRQKFNCGHGQLQIAYAFVLYHGGPSGFESR